MVVEVARAGRSRQPRLQHGMDHLPRGGLAHAAGHGDDRAGELPAVPGGPLRQGRGRVVDLNSPSPRRRSDRGVRTTAPAAPRRKASPTNSPPS